MKIAFSFSSMFFRARRCFLAISFSSRLCLTRVWFSASRWSYLKMMTMLSMTSLRGNYLPQFFGLVKYLSWGLTGKQINTGFSSSVWAIPLSILSQEDHPRKIFPTLLAITGSRLLPNSHCFIAECVYSTSHLNGIRITLSEDKWLFLPKDTKKNDKGNS